MWHIALEVVRLRNFLHKRLRRLYLEDDPEGLPLDGVLKLPTMLSFLQDWRDPEHLCAFPL